MTSFGWKRKTGEKVCRPSSSAFEKESKEVLEDGHDGLGNTLADGGEFLGPPNKLIRLEDAIAKSRRLKQEGAVLAEAERPWEALGKFDAALQLTPTDETLFEMKSQAYLMVNEVYPAVAAAEKAVELKPTWWVAHQTLGRAHLGLGEVRMAMKSFTRALHLNPASDELWEEDFKWAYSLLQQKRNAEAELSKMKETKSNIIELSDDDDSRGSHSDSAKAVKAYSKPVESKTEKKDKFPSNVDGKLPTNYVLMR